MIGLLEILPRQVDVILRDIDIELDLREVVPDPAQLVVEPVQLSLQGALLLVQIADVFLHATQGALRLLLLLFGLPQLSAGLLGGMPRRGEKDKRENSTCDRDRKACHKPDILFQQFSLFVCHMLPNIRS